jgi:hypothetical protein
MPDTDSMSLRSELVALRRSLARLEQQAGLEPAPLAAPPEGYRLVNPGDIVGSDDHNLVMGQSIPRFDNAAARNAAITAPAEGMYSYLKDVDRREVHNGTTWVGDALPKYGLRAYRAAALTASATANGVTAIPYDTEVYDQANAFAGGIYTCPVAGRYLVRASVSFSMLTGESAGCHLNKNGATDTLFLMTAGANTACQAQSMAVIMCAAGNTLSASMQHTVASKAVRVGATETFICIEYLGP